MTVLFLPGLLDGFSKEDLSSPGENNFPDLPALTSWLSRAEQRLITKKQSPLRTAFALLGYSLQDNEEIPVAALRSNQSVIVGQHWCLDPISLRIDQDTAAVMPPALLQITDVEAAQLIAALNQHFQHDGMQITMLDPTRWQLALVSPLQLNTTEINEAVDRDIRRVLPQGLDARRWRQWLNEIEMLLFHHPVNQQREQDGQLPVNSLWLWGGGTLRAAKSTSINKIYSDEPVVHDLARHMQIAIEPIPTAWKQAGNEQFQSIAMISFDALTSYSLYSRLNHLRLLEQNWFAPVLAALKTGKLSSATLHTGSRTFTLTAKHLRRWWRRRRVLRDWLMLAE